MEDLINLLGAGASVAGGGLFGFAGSVVSSIVKGKSQKAEREHQLKVQETQLKAAQDGSLQRLTEANQAMSAAGLVASIQSDTTTPNIPSWAVGAKAVYRLFLTTMLVCVSTYIFHMLLGALEGDNVLADAFPREQLLAMIRYTVYSLIFSTATAIVWWFGDRALTPPALK